MNFNSFKFKNGVEIHIPQNPLSTSLIMGGELEESYKALKEFDDKLEVTAKQE